jgi:hypothetical protein
MTGRRIRENIAVPTLRNAKPGQIDREKIRILRFSGNESCAVQNTQRGFSASGGQPN